MLYPGLEVSRRRVRSLDRAGAYARQGPWTSATSAP